MFYDEEEAGLFWESVEELAVEAGGEVRLAKAIDILAGWAVRDPLRAAPNDEGIRVLKLPAMYLDGAMTPPLRLAYYFLEQAQLSGAAGIVQLLHVGIYDQQQELLENGSAGPTGH